MIQDDAGLRKLLLNWVICCNSNRWTLHIKTVLDIIEEKLKHVFSGYKYF